MDDALFLEICRDQYGATLEMIRQAIENCPAELWDAEGDEPPFWQQAYHTIFFIDFYLSASMDRFRPPGITAEPAEDLAHRAAQACSREQLLDYLGAVIERCNASLDEMAAAGFEADHPFHWTGPTLAHRMIYNIRHAQHHVGWLNSMLKRRAEKPVQWVLHAP